jgi:hypothetical protein
VRSQDEAEASQTGRNLKSGRVNNTNDGRSELGRARERRDAGEEEKERQREGQTEVK